jgi:hypothetical protein
VPELGPALSAFWLKSTRSGVNDKDDRMPICSQWNFSSSLIALALLIPGAASAAPKDCDINGKSVNPDNGGTTVGLTGIMRCVDRETKQLAREQEV